MGDLDRLIEELRSAKSREWEYEDYDDLCDRSADALVRLQQERSALTTAYERDLKLARNETARWEARVRELEATIDKLENDLDQANETIAALRQGL